MGRRIARKNVRWLLALALAVSFGCGNAAIRDAGYHGTQGAIEGALDELGKLPDDTAQRMNDAVQGLTKSAVVGAGDGAKELELDKSLKKLLETFFQTTQEQTNALVKSLLDQQGPRLEATTRRLLVGTLNDARSELRQTTQDDLPKATRIVVTDAVDSFATAMGSEKVTTLRKDLVETTGAVTYTASASAVTGLRDELSKPETLDAVGALAKRIVSEATDGAKDSINPRDLWIVGALVGVFFLLAIAALVFYIRKSIVTSRALALIAQQINKGEHTDLKKRIKEKATDKQLEPFLRNFLLDRGL